MHEATEDKSIPGKWIECAEHPRCVSVPVCAQGSAYQHLEWGWCARCQQLGDLGARAYLLGTASLKPAAGRSHFLYTHIYVYIDTHTLYPKGFPFWLARGEQKWTPDAIYFCMSAVFPGCADLWGQPYVYICISLHIGIGAHSCTYTWLYLGRGKCSSLAPCRDSCWEHAPSQKWQHCRKSSARDKRHKWWLTQRLVSCRCCHPSGTRAITHKNNVPTHKQYPLLMPTEHPSCLIYGQNMSVFTPYRSILWNSWFPRLW